jgi:hypothetical protein
MVFTMDIPRSKEEIWSVFRDKTITMDDDITPFKNLFDDMKQFDYAVATRSWIILFVMIVHGFMYSRCCKMPDEKIGIVAIILSCAEWIWVCYPAGITVGLWYYYIHRIQK